MSQLKIREMPQDERPREKLLARGADALSNAELIAILLRTESLRVVLLDTRYRLMRVEAVSVGSMNESIAHPREIFRPAITYSAYAVIVVHNHPSGDPSPSQTDHSLTRRLAEAAELLQIKLLDHIIIGAPSDTTPGYFSFKEAGVL